MSSDRKATPPSPPAPRPYQVEAAQAALRVLETEHATTIAMPWGSGKTLTAILVSKQLVPEDSPILHLVASNYSVGKQRAEWRTHTTPPRRATRGPRRRAHPAGLDNHQRPTPPRPGSRTPTPSPSPPIAVCRSSTTPSTASAEPRSRSPSSTRVHHTSTAKYDCQADDDPAWALANDPDYLRATRRLGLSARPGKNPPTGRVAYRLPYEEAVQAGAIPEYRIVFMVDTTIDDAMDSAYDEAEHEWRYTQILTDPQHPHTRTSAEPCG